MSFKLYYNVRHEMIMFNLTYIDFHLKMNFFIHLSTNRFTNICRPISTYELTPNAV